MSVYPKTVEGRPYSSKYQKVEAGDSIVFASGSKKHEATVKSVKKYTTLKGYLQGEGLKKTLPGVSSMKGRNTDLQQVEQSRKTLTA